jgi:hypothetical protein
VVRFSRTSKAVAATSGVTSAPRFAPAAAMQVRAPPPSDELAREAPTRRHDDGGLVGNGGYVLGQVCMG